MEKGFRVICERCGSETILTSEKDNYMGCNGSDIKSSSSESISFNHVGKDAGIKCNCGNSILDR